MSLRDLRAIEPIPSEYTTTNVFRLERTRSGLDIDWRLRREVLGRPLTRTYDDGDIDDWLKSYEEASPADSLRFLGAWSGGQCVGLLTWSEVHWNNTVWLVDIRTRQKRSGIGSVLLAWLRRQTRAIEARGITVETQTTNYPAAQFYLKHGFVIVGFNDHLYNNDDLASGEVALLLFWECPH